MPTQRLTDATLVAGRPTWHVGIDVGIDVLNTILLAALAAVVLVRLVWVGQFYRVFWRAGGPGNRLAAVKHASTISETKAFSTAGGVDAQKMQIAMVSAAERLVESALLVGSIALAAWTQLFASAGQRPASMLHPLTRHLLLCAALVLVAGPALFRISGRAITSFGRASAAAVGYSALLVSLGSALADLFGTTGAIAAVLLAAVLVVVDIAEVRWLLRRHINADLTVAATQEPGSQIRQIRPL
jgi:hypothetical protein